MNEELRRRIEERRDEHEAIAARPGGGDNCQAYANALSWVLDLLDAQPAAVSLPTAFVRATTEDGLELWLEHDEGDALVHAGPAPTGSLALFVRGTISLPEEAEPTEPGFVHVTVRQLDGTDLIYRVRRGPVLSDEIAATAAAFAAPAVSLELPEPPACDSCAVTLETLALWPCVIDGCREYVTVHVPGYPDCTNRCAAHHREVFDPDDQVAIALPSTEPPIEDAGSGGVR